MMQNLKENWHVAWKMTKGIWHNFHASNRKSENLHFNGLLLSKAYKILDEKATNFDPTLESLKICTLMHSPWLKYIMFELKSHRGVFKEKLTGGLKNGRRNLINFHASFCSLPGRTTSKTPTSFSANPSFFSTPKLESTKW